MCMSVMGMHTRRFDSFAAHLKVAKLQRAEAPYDFQKVLVHDVAKNVLNESGCHVRVCVRFATVTLSRSCCRV